MSGSREMENRYYFTSKENYEKNMLLDSAPDNNNTGNGTDD
jgi:hypothetical protein